MQDIGEEIEFPTKKEYSWLIEHMMQAGPTTFDAMGNERSLTWADINEYHVATHELPAPWMRILVKEFSEEYLSGKNEGKNPLSMSPYAQQMEDDDE